MANGEEGHIPEKLPELAETYANKYLQAEACWDTEITAETHIQRVIAGKQYPYSYYSVITDGELYALAILCDLHFLNTQRGISPSAAMERAATYTLQMLSSPLLNQESGDGGWLFQVGAWAEHPDFAYAGNARIESGIQPKIREDIPWDSSHFSRMPLFLRSYCSAQTQTENRDVVLTRYSQLANQMVFHVLKNVDGNWLSSTFMDGTNGVYRYSYHEEGVGLEGYNLSGGLLLGWWALLNDSRISACYQEIRQAFPMETNAENPYFNGTTVREQNFYFDMDHDFENGMFQCLTACAANLRGTAV